ncbi:hypothetical protein GCM10010218_42600 [Streptomyces mashuensis]|uniref:Uncharacterized protein n=1 Tax=Streptomyces mashuensis TaxID=33904 RepID=A0A919B586_9ACTN|nr:hypothetical protein GCM10010218_42600 [Streptomyces mashuensis]
MGDGAAAGDDRVRPGFEGTEPATGPTAGAGARRRNRRDTPRNTGDVSSATLRAVLRPDFTGRLDGRTLRVI